MACDSFIFFYLIHSAVEKKECHPISLMVTQSSLSVCAFIIVSLFGDRFLYKLLYFSSVCLFSEVCRSFQVLQFFETVSYKIFSLKVVWYADILVGIFDVASILSVADFMSKKLVCGRKLNIEWWCSLWWESALNTVQRRKMSIKVRCFGCSSPLLKYFVIGIGCQHPGQVWRSWFI